MTPTSPPATAAVAGLRLWPRRARIAAVRAYRLLLSPWLGGQCRFEPTCSVYMIEALRRHGAVAGVTLGAGRLLRCHPWCDGGHDPVPDNAPWHRAGGLFTRWPGLAGDDASARPAPPPGEPAPSSKKNPT